MQEILELEPTVMMRQPPLRLVAAWSLARRDNVSCLALLTMILWVMCLSVGVCGLVFPYPQPRAKMVPRETIVTEKLVVELSDEPVTVGGSQLAGSMEMNAPVDAALPAPAPVTVAVALASPAIAFPIPVQGPVEIGDVARAGYMGPVVANSTGGTVGGVPGVETLTFGRGDGRQPAPEYPRSALRDGQEGTVQVRFLVGEDGRVLTVEAWQPSAWPVLDEAALRCVRQRWRFRPGPMRSYEVAIRFEIRK